MQKTIRSGLGIRPELFKPMFEQLPDLGFVEAHSENYFGDSLSRAKLLELRSHYPISLHGVGLSLGRADHLDTHHLSQLKSLVDQVEPLFVSEHLAWSAYSHQHLPDLLPLPLTEESLQVMCEHIDQMQSAIGQQVLVENPSNYLLFEKLQIPEPEFLNTLAKRTGCGLLLDINNVYVSAANTGRDAKEYLQQFNSDVICQYHLAGYTPTQRNGEEILIDTHNQPVYEPVWELFNHVLRLHGARPTLFEWDSDFPEFNVLLDECRKADQAITRCDSLGSKKVMNGNHNQNDIKHSQEVVKNQSLRTFQQDFLDATLNLKSDLPEAIADHQSRISVYQNNVYGAIRDYLEELYAATKGVVGADFFKQMVHVYVQQSAPSEGNIHSYGRDFISVIDQFSGLRDLPYLADLIQYEWCLHYAYFAVIECPLNPSELTQEELLTLPIQLNSSVGLIKSDYPIAEIHRQSLPSYTEQVSIDLQQSADNLLVFKNDYRVNTRHISDSEADFIDRLQNSENLLKVIEGFNRSIDKTNNKYSESDDQIDENVVASMLSMVFELKLLNKNTKAFQ